MTGRQRLLSVFQGEIPDRLPWAPMVNPYFLDAVSGPMKGMDKVDFLRHVGADVAERWVPTSRGWGLEDPAIVESGSVTREDLHQGEFLTARYRTPAGTLQKVMRRTEHAGETWFCEEPLIKTLDDLQAYRCLWEKVDPRADYARVRDRIGYIGDDGIAMVLVPSSPLIQLIMYDLGLENTMYFLEDAPDEMEELMELMGEKSLRACEIAADSPAMVGIIPENSGTMLVTPSQFEQYCLPILSRYAQIFESRGKFLFLHACGHLDGLLSLIAQTGLTGVESLTPPPTGDVKLARARQVLGEKMTIFGGLDPVRFLSASPHELRDLVRQVIDQVRPGRRFVLMPSDSTPAGVPLENFYAVRDAIAEYGLY